MNQLTLDFTSGSRLNRKHLTGQNKTIYDYLQSGNTITSFEAFNRFKVTALHSRISDLRNKIGIVIYDRFINVDGVTVKEYSLKLFDSVTV